MEMNHSAARRLWLYGLLLLLPALAVGGLALGLLAREQARLAEREAAASEARNAAVESRARLIAENIELLVGDVQAALMATLEEAPELEPRAFLSDWKTGNALVRDVFRATGDGRMIWGGPVPALGAWTDFDQGKATGVATLAAEHAQAAPAAVPQAEVAREDIASNVVQYRKAREELQVIARQRVVAAPVSPPTPAASADFFSRSKLAVAEEAKSEVAAPRAFADGASVSAAKMEGARQVTGWTPWTDEDGVRLIGWRRLNDGSVIGLELALDAIKARLGEAFPANTETGEAYELRDGFGRLWHRSGGEGLAGDIAIPLAVFFRLRGGVGCLARPVDSGRGRSAGQASAVKRAGGAVKDLFRGQRLA
jgi:two-component system, OmpR family, phosphate regulon sensor histidine kinase PhoR